MSGLLRVANPDDLLRVLPTLERPDNLILVAPPYLTSMRLKSVRGLALDFDNTAAVGSRHITCLDHLAGEELQERLNARRRAHTDDMDLSHPEEYYAERDRDWIEDNIQILALGKRTRADIEEHSQIVKLRTGTLDLLNYFGDRSTVISMGIKPVIECVLQAQGAACKVYATNLEFDAQDVILGRTPSEEVFISLRKGEALQDFAAQHALQTTDFLVAGDSQGDRKLFELGGVKAFVIPTTPEGNFDLRPYRLAALHKLWHQIDLIVTDTLVPLYDYVVQTMKA